VATSKKTAAKATAKKKAAAKKTSAVANKKTASKKTAAKKVAAKKVAAKKVAAKKTAAKAAPAAKKVAAKTTAKKSAKATPKATAKVAAKKTAKVSAKPAASATAKKAAAKKATAKKATTKVAANKAAVAKPETETKTAKKAAAKKSSSKKAVAKKATGKAKSADNKLSKASEIPSASVRADTNIAMVDTQTTVVPYERDKSDHYMTDEQLEAFRKQLLDWKQQLMEEVDRTVDHMKDDATNFPDPNDRATQEEEFSLELRTRDRERKLIKKINEAIKRIDDDEYGYCETCGIEIGNSRLEARPTAELCIDCKTLEEIRERQIA